LCGVVLLGKSSLLDVNQEWDEVGIQVLTDFFYLIAKYFVVFELYGFLGGGLFAICDVW